MATAKQVSACDVAHYSKLQAEASLLLLSVAPFVIKTELQEEESAISTSLETHSVWSWGIY